MKFALALLALVATSTAWQIPNIGRGELAKELQDILDIMPQDKIVEITLRYYNEDAEFKDMIQYFMSEDFKKLVVDVEKLPEIKALMDYIHKAGLDIYYLVNKLNELLKIALRLTPPNYVAMGKQATGGLRGYIDELEAAIEPVKNEIIALYLQKLQDPNNALTKFVKELQSPNFQQIVNKVYYHQKFQELLKHAEEHKVDLKRIKELLELILGGIVIPPRPF